MMHFSVASADNNPPWNSATGIGASTKEVEPPEILALIVGLEQGTLREPGPYAESISEMGIQLGPKIFTCENLKDLDARAQTGHSEIILQKIDNPVPEWNGGR